MSKQPSRHKAERQDYQRALQSMDTFIDVGVDDLMLLAQRAQHFAAQRVTETLRVTRVMSQPVRTVGPDVSMSEAAHIMVSERISGLPVVDNSGVLVGVITEADFLRGLGVPAHHPTLSIWQTLELLYRHLADHGAMEGPDDPVANHMVTDVVCASAEDDVERIVALMTRHRVKRIPVCDADRHVLGMVTRSDLVRLFFDRFLQDASD